MIILYLKYDILNFDQTENDKLLLANIASFFKVISVEVAIKVLYSKINEKHQPILDIINKNKLFEPINIIELINAGNLDLAITLLNTDKEYYSKNDIEKCFVNSFDVFDTLLARKVLRPTDIFSIVEETYNIPNFKLQFFYPFFIHNEEVVGEICCRKQE